MWKMCEICPVEDITAGGRVDLSVSLAIKDVGIKVFRLFMSRDVVVYERDSDEIIALSEGVSKNGMTDMLSEDMSWGIRRMINPDNGKMTVYYLMFEEA